MKLTVIGLGCVGTVAAAGLAAAGYDVLGVDLDRQRIARLSSGEVPFYEPGLQARVGTALQEGRRCGSCTGTRFRNPWARRCLLPPARRRLTAGVPT